MDKRPGSSSTAGKSRGLKRKSGGIADWSSVESDAIRDAISAAAFTGGALRFGYSRDGGAYAIGIYGDGEPYTEWIKPGESVEEILGEIRELFEAIKDEQAQARSSPQKAKNPPPGQ